MSGEGVYEPRKIAEIIIPCPNCGRDAFFTVYEHSIPENEVVLIETLKCSHCGFRQSNVVVRDLKEAEYKCIELEVLKDIDLNTMLYINPGTVVEFKDVGVSIDIHMLDIGYIITVDALIMHALEVIKTICTEGVESTECRNVIDVLSDVLDGKKALNIVLRDPLGLTHVVRTYRDNFRFCQTTPS